MQIETDILQTACVNVKEMQINYQIELAQGLMEIISSEQRFLKNYLEQQSQFRKNQANPETVFWLLGECLKAFTTEIIFYLTIQDKIHHKAG